MAARSEPNLLGEFLRARREQLQPEGLGLPDTGRRRVRGLRREEVAMQAGVSADYYVHLEQGRDRHPSEQVIQALGRVLALDEDAIAYVRKLAAPKTPRRQLLKEERVAPGVLQILDTWRTTAAIVQGRFRDVLACTAVAAKLHPGFNYDPNTVRLLFLDADERAMHVDWERDARESVAWLRAAIADDLDNPRVNELVGELAVKSEEFGRIWARHDVRRKTSGGHRLVHPIAGEINLGYQSFAINSSPGQSMTIYHALDEATSQGLALLATLADDEPESGTSNVVLLEDKRSSAAGGP